MKPGGQRIKGKIFERKIAAMIRKRWPAALVRRASQAERAHNPDVFVEGGPRILQRLWLELQDAAHPTPSKKLEQARRDVLRDPRTWERGASRRLPIAITHKFNAREITATLALHDLADIIEPGSLCREDRDEVTVSLETFLKMVSRGIAREAEGEAA